MPLPEPKWVKCACGVLNHPVDLIERKGKCRDGHRLIPVTEGGASKNQLPPPVRRVSHGRMRVQPAVYVQ